MENQKTERSYTGQKIYDARKKLGLTQVELADELGVSQQLVTFWEKSGKPPTAEMIIKISQLFNISADELLGIHHTEPELKPTRLNSRFNRISQLSRRKQERIISVIDTLLEDSNK